MNFNKLRFARTKTVATVGPASRTPHQLMQLIQAGVDVFRVNMAHGTRDEHNQVIDAIRQASQQARMPVGVLVDLAGPKIRLGELFGGVIETKNHDELIFVRGTQATAPNQLVSNYPSLLDDLAVGKSVVLADGTVSLQVVEKLADGVRCVVTDGGPVRSKQGINLPDVELAVETITEQDRQNAQWAAERQVDFVSLSFVRSEHDLNELRQLLTAAGSRALVVAKIEKREALRQLESIVRAADGVMVARGDLGVEIDIAATPIAQKEIIRECQRQQKPVIVATQMLESMHESKRPTRAEATDVANAILDGADACMLSGETAIGNYPIEAVRVMNRIMIETEQLLQGQPSRVAEQAAQSIDRVTRAIVYGAAQIAKQLEAKVVVIASRTAGPIRVKSNQRDFVPTLCVTDSSEIYRKANLFWGITPLQIDHIDDAEALDTAVRQWAHEHLQVAVGDFAVYAFDSATIPSAHDSVVVRHL